MYQEIIDEMFVTDPRNQDRSGDMRLHPSAISGCERNAMYKARGEAISNERDVRFTRIMGNGTDYHEKLQAFLIKKFPSIVIEPDVLWGPIKGSADALMPVGDGLRTDKIEEGDPWPQTVYELQEFKTISPNGKRYIQGTKPRKLKSGKFKPGRDAAPKPEHVKQARIYYYCLEKMGMLLNGVIRLLYIDRDDWSTLEFEVEPWTVAEGMIQEEVWADLEAHLMDGTLPDQEPDDYWLCKMCEFRTTCKDWKDE
jgi:hypothetical protein